MKIMIIGANGQLGTDLVRVLSFNQDEIIPFTHDQLEISDLVAVRSCISTIYPEVVINTAAYHNVEKCEENPGMAFSVNALGARNLAIVTKEINALLVHISTDYVFDGTKRTPYIEADLPSPLQVYGNSKLAGEYFIKSITSRYQIVRTSGLFGKNPCRAKGHNFVELMLKLAKERDQLRVVNDEVLTPTSTLEVARQIKVLIYSGNYGIFHATAEGKCSWFEFAQEVFRIKGIKTNLVIADPSEFPAKIPRPKYSVLENANLKACGLNILKDWNEGLTEYLMTS